MPHLSQWKNLSRTLNIASNKIPENLYDELIAHYREDHRHYHTLQHLDECLEKFAELKFLAEHPVEIELALWFHDAIYQPTWHDNEQLSANWAKTSLLTLGLKPTQAERIANLVLITRHDTLPKSIDEKIMVDVDLAILAAIPERFQQYQQQIHQEYNFVPYAVFRSKRKKILQGFLTRNTIFNTEPFIEHYEQQARINLSHALEQL